MKSHLNKVSRYGVHTIMYERWSLVGICEHPISKKYNEINIPKVFIKMHNFFKETFKPINQKRGYNAIWAPYPSKVLQHFA